MSRHRRVEEAHGHGHGQDGAADDAVEVGTLARTAVLASLAAFVVAAVVGAARMAVGQAHVLPTCINMVWIVYDLVVLSVVVQAARYRGFEPQPTGPAPVAAVAA